VTTGTKKVDAFRALFCGQQFFFYRLPSVLTEVEGNADMVLAEAVTEAEAVEDALLEEGEGDAAVLEGTGTGRPVSDRAHTALPLVLSSTEE
jgi:hypothetical protein